MENCGISLDELDAVLEKGPSDDKPPKPPAPDGATETETVKPKRQRRTEMDDEYDKCVAYVAKFPEVELIEGPGRQWLKYRCTVCVTRRQKQGKVNKLGKPILRECQHYLHQHLDSHEHQRRKLRHEHVQAAVSLEADGEKIPCKGVWVSDPNGKTVLHWHYEEFKVWTSFVNLESKMVRNEYDTNISQGHYFSKHHLCEGEYAPAAHPDRKCCAKCWSLTSPKSITKTVTRFARKYYAAQLLQKRLFHTEDDVKRFQDEMAATSFAKRHEKAWKDIVEKSNAQLQSDLRDEWRSDNNALRTTACKMFISTVVQPCLAVHVSAVTSNVTFLAQKFVDALEGGQMDASWRMECQVGPWKRPVPKKSRLNFFL